MNKNNNGSNRPVQQGLFDEEVVARSLLDQLLSDSRLYTSSKDYKDLLDFVARLRNFAPFNAMLLQVQKPGVSYAASAKDWRDRFGRFPKEGARPLLILWPFGPVALVYDVLDTEGEAPPNGIYNFVARGPVDVAQLQAFQATLSKKNISLGWVDQGDLNAGRICVARQSANEKDATQYSIKINSNHDAPAKFVTLAHELAHLALGHLGPDKKLSVPTRCSLSDAQQELEAESVAYLVCERNGIQSESHRYLSNFIQSGTTVDDLDIYQVMRAAGQVESLLGIAAHARFDRPSKEIVTGKSR